MCYLKVVILAGGYGTRISEESHLRPKPMIEIGERPILWHIMKYYLSYGFDDFIICCGYKGYVIKEYFDHYFLRHSNITFDFKDNGKKYFDSNTSEPWRVTLIDTGLDTMTGGRIKRIKDFIGNECFHMTYGDGISNINLHDLIKNHKSSNNTVTLSAVHLTGRFGILNIDDHTNNIIGFHEKARHDGDWINAGFMIMEPDIFNYIDNDETILERIPLESLSKEKKLGVYRHDGYWRCMDTQRDKYILESDWENGNAPWKIW